MANDSDIISVGDDRRQPLRLTRRTKQILSLLIVGTLFAYAGWRVFPGRGRTSRLAPRPSAEARIPSIQSSPSLPGQNATGLPLPPDDVLPLGEPTGARLVLGGSQLVDITLDSGDVSGTPVVGRVRQTLHVRGGDVMLVAVRGTRIGTATYISTDRTKSVVLGTAINLVPAVDDTHVWLANPPESGVVRKVGLDGDVETKADLSPFRVAIRETKYGMVTTSSRPYSSSLELWDLTTGRLARTDWIARNFIIADADAEHTAFTLPNCDLPMCPVKIAITRSGEVINAVMPPGWTTSKAAFSPDGSKLAVIGSQVTRNAPDQPGLVIVDLASGAFRSASGVEPDEYRAGLAWSADGRWLFALAKQPTDPVLGYRLGDRRVRYVPFPRGAQFVDPADPASLSAY